MDERKALLKAHEQEQTSASEAGILVQYGGERVVDGCVTSGVNSDAGLPTHNRISFENLENYLNEAFSEIRSESEASFQAITHAATAYSAGSVLSRAFPERYLALLVTLAIEIPVVLVISGGGKSICEVLGNKKYTILLAFLPLCSAISGNVGLQASNLTTRAISHELVTRNNFMTWMKEEFCVACALSLAVSAALASLALLWVYAFTNSLDFGFAVTIATAQMLSILAAGISGTCAPLFFAFVAGRDAGKWAGPLETAVQDVVGSSAMVYLSIYMLRGFVQIGWTPHAHAHCT
ncbi:Magnesium transporter MgtE [Porphyridium purpureum]|uniref:Magnesium transporter MgtE n=1 Tax=Porphyridium purpureum TaxID=35688 RepID=A0A5J4YWH6_PORPP|nr:Magnesium transporter MgtE [Porphyridium purpureum]|eukprot:POR4675..scf209_3